MSQINPYAAPTAAQPLMTGMPATHAAVFRQGDMVVMHRKAVLPNICFYTGGQPSAERLSVELTFTPWWVRFFFGGLIAYMFTKRETVQLPLEQSVWESRASWMWIWIGVGVASVLGIVLAVALFAMENDSLAAIGVVALLFGIGGLLTAVIGAIITFAAPTTYYMDEHYIWIKGAHENFLALLPAWPYPPQ